jgi:hypothetical protein
MSGIFLSWSGRDVQAVTALKNQLAGLRVPIWEYRDQMRVGDTIHETVVDAIADSFASVVCFSDETAHAPWIQDELAWAYLAYGKDTSRILPVWVGPHPANLKPRLIDLYNLAVGDLTVEQGRENLIAKINAVTGAKPPLVVPAAIFALTADEAEPLLQTPDLLTLCDGFGMRKPPDVVAQLRLRYGASAADFSPLANQQPLKTVIDDTVDHANAIRKTEKLRPIFLRWMHDELGGKFGEEARQEARKRWRSSPSLLVIDSISTLDPNMRIRLDNLIEDRSAILWVPPFTLHTNTVSDLLRRTAGRLERLSDALADWQEKIEPQFAIDAPTELSVRLWLHRTFVALSDTARPIKTRVQGVQRVYKGPSTVKEFTDSPTNVDPAFSGAPQQ